MPTIPTVNINQAPVLLAGVLLLVLAAVLLFANPGKRINRAFSFLLLVEGFRVGLTPVANAGSFQGDFYWSTMLVYFYIAAPIAALYVAVLFYSRFGPRPAAGRAWLRWPVLAFGVLCWTAYAVNDALWNPGEPLSLLTDARPLCYAIVAAVLAFSFSSRPVGAWRDSLRLAGTGFLINGMFDAARALAAGAMAVVADAPRQPHWSAYVLLPSYMVALAVGAFAASRLVRNGDMRAGDAGWLARGWPALAFMASIVVGATVGIVSRGIQNFGVGVPEGINSGLDLTSDWWELLAAALIAYALLKYRFLGIELRTKQMVSHGTIVAFFLATFIAAAWLAGNFVEDVATSLIIAALPTGLLGFALVPLRSVGRRVADAAFPDVHASRSYRDRRRLEVYFAAMEDARHAGDPDESQFLEVLRRKLGVSKAEHRVMVLTSRSVQRIEDAPGRASTRFTIRAELGRGAHGRALLAHDKKLDREVVLKQPVSTAILDEENHTAFLREARLYARVNHPNVVTLHEVLTDGELPMLVMEYVKGGGLDVVLRGPAKLEPARAVRIARDVLAGLGAMHEAGIIHRDVKPGNILIQSDGTAKITDFGIALRKTADATLTVASQPTQAGSLAYMTPEQVRGETANERSDLYAMGAVLYEMLAGRWYLDFKGRSESEIRRMVERSTHDPLPVDVPAKLKRLVARALSKSPAQRFASANAMRKALQA